MAGKKTGKRLLTWVLVLVMALSLLPLNALAANSGSGMNFDKQLADDKPDGDGNYTIQITAQATGTTTTTTTVKPMDIVLVLDQSGSMADDFGNGTRQSAMKAAVNSFIDEVAKKHGPNADHRMAIVTFGSGAETLKDWTAVDKSGEAALTGEISGLTDSPSGATNVGAGMQMAKNLMDSDANTGGNTDRLKTVIVFTDGVPTKQSDFNTEVANTAISAAKAMKDDDVTIYTVGIFNGANPDEMYGASGFDKDSDGTIGSKWIKDTWGLFPGTDFPEADRPAGNRFLNLVSSNYPNADSIGLKRETEGLGILHYKITYKITENFNRDSSDYYKTATDASDLANIFEKIATTVPEPVNDKLDENTVITDTLSDYFTFARTEDGKVDVKVYAEKTDGSKRDIVLPEGPDGIDVKGKTVTVTGYDFSKHYQGIGDAEETLVIEIKVKPSGEGYTSANIPTNDDTNETLAARVEVEVASEDGTGTETKVVTSHKTAKVTGHQVIYELAGGEGDMTGNGLYYPQGAAVPVTDSKPTLEGHEFTGWTITKPDTDSLVINTDETTGKKTFTMPAADVTLTAQWKTKTDLSYTVNYLEQGTNEVLHKKKTTGNQTFGTEIPSSKEVIDIDGYTHVSADPETLTIGTGENVINLYYTKRTDLSYTVKYVDKNTGSEIQSSVVKGDKTFGDKVTGESEQVTIANYTYVEAKPDPLTIGTDATENVITLYYTKDAPTPGTFDFNDVDHSDDKATPAITKTVKGNVGKNFTEAFYVTVKGADEKSTATMATAPYTGKAEVIASKSLKDVPFLFKPEVMANAVVPYGELRFTEAGTYTYTVREEVPGKPSRMSYDTTEYTLTIEVVLNENANTYQVKSWQFTAGNSKYPTPLNIVNTYRTYHPSTPSKPTLNTGDHYAYVMGYPDGTVRPNGSITRAEVSAILFRLLSDKTRDEYFTTESSFTDVKAGAWYNNSIATLEKAGVIVDTAKGGAFRPNEAITRAELAAMLAQFSDAKPVKGVKFSDVSAEHWAYEAIAIAAKMGWIEGYPDGTFRPDATITRAEMMTLVNRALERVPSDEDHLLSKRVMLTFPDCKSGDWFYIAVQEATNSHTYERAATEKNGDEQWTALRANRDWTLLEK